MSLLHQAGFCERMEPRFFIGSMIAKPNSKDILRRPKRGPVWDMKGVRRILEERGLGHQDELKKQGKHWNARCGSIPVADRSCCRFHLLAAQPDFLEQKAMLHLVIIDAGHLFSLYPKYYC